jgi:hypothetical protein
MRAVRYFLTAGPGTFDADYRAWLDRHPGVFWTGRIIVLTVALLIAIPIVAIVLSMLPVFLFPAVALGGFLLGLEVIRRL